MRGPTVKKFTYTGDDERDFPTLGVTLKPGDVVEAAGNPDPSRFSEAKASKPAPTKE